ncbi:MAG: tRNA pseudouridine(38-40) synthase TruA [Actinomycetota bacterium]
MPTYRLDIAYDGGGFHGYARQPDVRTVQGELEAVLAPYTGGAATHVAGRTDKGVHASEQVVSFACEELDSERVVRSINSQLAPLIAARSLSVVADDFHARYSATGRAYRYRINNSAIHDPLDAATTWTYDEALDDDAMNDAVAMLIGNHDFSAFCRKREGLSNERELLWSHWRRSGNILQLSIGANSFCHQMVRSIVGMCTEIGRGRVPLEAVPGILASPSRHRLAGAAPAHGLTLVAVAFDYEPLPKPSWVPEIS